MITIRLDESEAIQTAVTLEREIERIEAGKSHWGVWEKDLRNVAGRLRAAVHKSTRGHNAYLDNLSSEEMDRMIDQMYEDDRMHEDQDKKNSAGPDRPAEANMGVEHGNDAAARDGSTISN